MLKIGKLSAFVSGHKDIEELKNLLEGKAEVNELSVHILSSRKPFKFTDGYYQHKKTGSICKIEKGSPNGMGQEMLTSYYVSGQKRNWTVKEFQERFEKVVALS